MSRVITIGAILTLFAVLAAIRFFETDLFYDPLLSFYEGDYLRDVVPQFQLPKLILYTGLRFLLNTAISLLILYLAFKDKNILKFSLVIYVVLFAVLMMIFLGMLLQVDSIENYMPLFYVRRFLIQPLLIILLLPAFYYYKRQHSM